MPKAAFTCLELTIWPKKLTANYKEFKYVKQIHNVAFQAKFSMRDDKEAFYF